MGRGGWTPRPPRVRPRRPKGPRSGTPAPAAVCGAGREPELSRDRREGHRRELRGDEGRGTPERPRSRKQGVLGARTGARGAERARAGGRARGPGEVGATSEELGGSEEAGRLLLTFHELASPD